jgi:hypothetical protein
VDRRVPTTTETTRNTPRATRSSPLSTVNVCSGGVKKKFRARNEMTDAAIPAHRPARADTPTTARTYRRAAMVVGTAPGAIAGDVAAAVSRTTTRAERTDPPLGRRCAR